MIKEASGRVDTWGAGFPIRVHPNYVYIYIWVVVKIMVPFWVPVIIWPLIFRVPKKGSEF